MKGKREAGKERALRSRRRFLAVQALALLGALTARPWWGRLLPGGRPAPRGKEARHWRRIG